jgi:hypothetical protein
LKRWRRLMTAAHFHAALKRWMNIFGGLLASMPMPI